MHTQDFVDQMLETRRYKDFAPTSLDCRGLALPDLQNWIVGPVSHNRDSGIREESNWDCTLRELGGESDTVEVHRFGHWGNGWYEIILINPADQGALTAAAEILCSLSDYPILDDSDHSAREHDLAWENVEQATYGLVIDNPSDDWLQRCYDWLSEYAEHMGWYESPEEYSVREPDMRACLAALNLLDSDEY